MDHTVNASAKGTLFYLRLHLQSTLALFWRAVCAHTVLAQRKGLAQNAPRLSALGLPLTTTRLGRVQRVMGSELQRDG